MGMTYKAFARKLYGTGCKRLARTLFTDLFVFWGLYIADVKMGIAPFILYLMTGAFTAGVMWQALSAKDHVVEAQNLFMLPFHRRELVFSYVAALGTYTLLTKTAALLAVLLAVSVWNPREILGCILCGINAVLVTATVYSYRKHWFFWLLWGAGALYAILCLWNSPWFLPALILSGVLSFVLLWFADAYSFYSQGGKSIPVQKGHKHFSVWRYLSRYLGCHRNYLANTAAMWVVACVLPLFPGQMEGLFAVPMGFAILSINTPLCILLSCDPSLEQAVRVLPGQKRAFLAPYCLFIFLCNMAADIIFLTSLQIQTGGVTAPMIAAAFFFALQSAVFSVLLEWFYPVRGWKIESDLWHHPRKYLVPAVMLLLAGVVGTFPGLIPVLIVLTVVETAVLF